MTSFVDKYPHAGGIQPGLRGIAPLLKVAMMTKKVTSLCNSNHLPTGTVADRQDSRRFPRWHRFESAKEFWEHHPLYHTWKFKGWACQFGNRAPPERGKA